MQIACPAALCGAVMNLPENAMGKKGRCPRCKDAFIVAPNLVVQSAEAAAEAGVAPAPGLAPAPVSPPPEPRLTAPAPPVPVGPQGAVTPGVGPRRDSARRVRAQTSPDTFEPERRIASGGMWIGLAVMVGAAIWFGVGWYFGYIYFYAPVLFIIGLIGFVRGLGEAATGGGGRGRPRARAARR